MLSFKPAFSLSSFTLIKRLFCSSLSVVRVVSSACLRLLIFLLAILIPGYDAYSLALSMMYSAYELNKHGGNMEPWCTPSPVFNQSIVPCPFLTVAFCPAYKFLRRQIIELRRHVRCSGIPVSLRNVHSLLWSTVKGFSMVNESEVYIYFFPCFFYDPKDAGNLISGFSAVSKSSLYIWKFLVHMLA